MIQTWGGIGDILRELAWVPHGALYRATGLRCPVRHLPRGGMSFHSAAVLPDGNFVGQLVARCPSLRWSGEGDCPRAWRLANRAFRQIIWFAGGRARLFPFEIRLSPAEREILPSFGGTPLIGVQTHLEGLPGKRWEIDRWAMVLRGLGRAFPDARLLLLEPSKEGIPLAGSVGAIWCGDLSLFQAIRLVAGLDLLVSVDSWSKYIAASHRVPQVVIVPDQTPDYPQLTAGAVWRHSLAGVAGLAEVRLLGIEHDAAGARYTLDRMADLDPGGVVLAARSLADRIPRKRAQPDSVSPR